MWQSSPPRNSGSALRTSIPSLVHPRAPGVLGAALLLSAAAAPAGAQTQATSGSAGRHDLLATDSVWSSRSADSGLAVLEAVVAPDVWYLVAGQPLAQGSARVVALLRGDASRLAWRAIGAGLSSDGNLGYTYGYTVARDSAASRGKYMAVWARRGTRWELAAFVLAGGGPATPPAETLAFAASGSTGDAHSARRAVMATDSAFARDAASLGVAEAFAAHAAPDAAILSGPPSIVVGRAGIHDVYATLPPSARLVWAPVDARAAASGDLAFTVGTAIFSVVDPATGRTRRAYSKYLTIWRRQSDGRWTYVVDGGNARPRSSSHR